MMIIMAEVYYQLNLQRSIINIILISSILILYKYIRQEPSSKILIY
jgi:hypothetical protein